MLSSIPTLAVLYGTVTTSDRLTKWNKIFTETVASGAVANNYAVGDVVAVADVSAGTSSLYVVTTALAAGVTATANALVMV